MIDIAIMIVSFWVFIMFFCICLLVIIESMAIYIIWAVKCCVTSSHLHMKCIWVLPIYACKNQLHAQPERELLLAIAHA